MGALKKGWRRDRSEFGEMEYLRKVGELGSKAGVEASACVTRRLTGIASYPGLGKTEGRFYDEASSGAPNEIESQKGGGKKEIPGVKSAKKAGNA